MTSPPIIDLERVPSVEWKTRLEAVIYLASFVRWSPPFEMDLWIGGLISSSLLQILRTDRELADPFARQRKDRITHCVLLGGRGGASLHSDDAPLIANLSEDITLDVARP